MPPYCTFLYSFHVADAAFSSLLLAPLVLFRGSYVALSPVKFITRFPGLLHAILIHSIADAALILLLLASLMSIRDFSSFLFAVVVADSGFFLPCSFFFLFCFLLSILYSFLFLFLVLLFLLFS